MRVGIKGDDLIHGREFPIWVEDGPPNGTATVKVDDLGQPEPRTAEVKVPLNENGAGWVYWTIPPWPWVRVSADGCQALQQPADPPRKRVSARVGRALDKLSRAIGFVSSNAFDQHQMGLGSRLGLFRRIKKNYWAGSGESHLRQHLLLAEEILAVPSSIKGDVVECGCANGAASAALSLACAASNRRLFVCDSFKGLPPVKEGEVIDHRFTGRTIDYQEGDYASKGGLEGVKERIRTHGNIDVCHFVEGFFEDTLEHIATDSIVLVFEDADLITSVRDCLTHLWPKLQPGCKFFCHEPWSYDIVSLFHDEAWWRKELDLVAPGFIGSGVGDPLAPGLGYALKLDPNADPRQREYKSPQA